MKNRKFFVLVVIAFIIVLIICCSSIVSAPKPQTTDIQSTITTITQVTSKPITTTKPQCKEIIISFLGDCMMASYKGQKTFGNMNWYLDNNNFSYFFEKAMPYIGHDDFTIANCENVFTDTATTERKKQNPAFWFRSSIKNANVFSENSIDAVSIANNHINDYGSNGKKDTIYALENAGILWGNDDKVIFLEKDGVSIGVLCVCFWGEYNVKQITSKITSIKNSTDIQIVFFHGGKERLHQPEQWKVNGCHAFVDAGADLVVGSHPHVLQPYESYNNVDVIYSIGNFCFGGNKLPENRTIILQETFVLGEDNKLVSTSEKFIPFYVYTGKTNNWQPAPIENQKEKSAVLDFMYGKTNSPF